MEQQREELNEREKVLKGKEKKLKEREAFLKERERLLEERKRASFSIGNDEPKKDHLSKDEQKLINEALKIYKIPREYVLSYRAYPETEDVVIVTMGGKKFKHHKGEQAKFKLTKTEITGDLPEQDLRWHEKLNQRIDLKALLKRG